VGQGVPAAQLQQLHQQQAAAWQQQEGEQQAQAQAGTADSVHMSTGDEEL
jgi:hypothetical protein